MAFEIKIQEIIRKHQLLAIDNRTEQEEAELQKITTMLNGIVKELAELELKGCKVVKGISMEKAENDIKTEKPKMSIEDRKMRAEAIVREGKEKKKEDKVIINEIRDELGVSYTYASKIVRGK